MTKCLPSGQPTMTKTSLASRALPLLLSGLIAAESAGSLTLRRAEGKEDVVLRSNIETLASNGVSLMPEGLEKEITPAQMADLLAYIKSLQPAGK